jgi:ABC-type tungstate transport system permease subunit
VRIQSPVLIALLAGLLLGGCVAASGGNDLALDRKGKVLPLDLAGGYARPRQVYLLQDGAPVTLENPDRAADPSYVTAAHYPAALPELAVRLANGGAGGAGLLEALAYAYLEEQAATGGDSDFAIAWYLTDTTYSLQALQHGVVDIAITYNRARELPLLAEGTVQRRQLAFMDHFMLVGPESNPADIAPQATTAQALAAIIDRGCAAAFAGTPRADCAYFLSRDDLSATQIKERELFDQVIARQDRFAGYRDRAYAKDPGAAWYVLCPQTPVACFPAEALRRTGEDAFYTLTDWGTWLANADGQHAHPDLAIYVTGLDPAGQPLLLNPAAALLSTAATPRATAFFEWLLADEGGQAVIRRYGTDKFGAPLYVPAADVPDREIF